MNPLMQQEEPIAAVSSIGSSTAPLPGAPGTRSAHDRGEIVRIELRGEVVPKGAVKTTVVHDRNGNPILKNGRAIVRKFTPPRTVEYMGFLRVAAQVAMAGRPPIAGPVEMTMLATMVPPKSWSAKKRERALRGEIVPMKTPDWTNIGKQEDALTGVVFLDDSQVVDGRVHKVYGETPGLTIEVRELEGVEGA